MRLEDLFEANPALKVSGSVVGGKSPVVLGTEFFDMAKKQGATPKQASNVIELFQKNNPQFRGPKMTQFMQQFFTNNPDVFKTANDNVKLATGSGSTGKVKGKIKPSGWSKLLGLAGRVVGGAAMMIFGNPTPAADGTISDEDRQAMQITNLMMQSLSQTDPQAFIDMIDAEYKAADRDDVQFVDPRTHPYYTDAQKRVADTQKMLDLEPIGGGIPQPSAQSDASTLAQPGVEPEELPTSQPDKTPKFPGIPVLPDLPGPESPLEIPQPAPSVAPTAPKQPEPTQDPEDKPDAPTRDKPIEIPTTTPTKPEVDPGKETEPTVDPDAPSPKGPVVNPDAPGQPQAPVTDPEKLPDAPKVIDKPVTTRAPSTLTVPGPAPRVNTDIGTTQPPRGSKEKPRKRVRGMFGLPDLTKKQRDYTLSPFRPLPMPDPMKLARYKSFGESVEEREMTKAEKAKETRLKKKYDDSDMKAAMKKQYGKDWETVYYATIRKQAMEEGYQILPPIDRDRYDEIQGMEGPMITRSGKVVYYDPQQGAYYDRDTDMYLTYDEWKELDKEPHTAESVNPKDDPYSEPGRPGGKNQYKGKTPKPLPNSSVRGNRLQGAERSLGMPDPMNIHARLNASVEQRANALFDRALAEFEFNPRAGHRDQPSHPENRGLTNPRSTSPRPRLRPGSEIDLSPDAEAPDQVHVKKSGAPASSPRPRLRPKDVEMKAAIDAAVRQAMGEADEADLEEEGMIIYVGDQKFEYYDYTLQDAMNVVDEYADEMDGEPYEVYNADGKLVSSGTMRSGAFHEPGIEEGQSVNEWGGDDQYQAVEGFIENALGIFDEMLDNGVDELRARAEAHDYLKGELGDLGVTHGDMESKQYHSELEKEIVQIMNLRDKGVKESARGLGSIDWPDVDEDGDSAMSQHAENAIRHGMHAYDAYDHVYSMSRERDWLSDNKDMIIDMFAQYGLQTEGHSPHKKGTAKYKAHMAAMHAGMNEGEEKPYICVHAKKGKHECRAESSYAAAKKAAAHWGLKSTAGIDAHLAIDEGKYGKKKKKKKKYNEADTDLGYGAAIGAGALGSAYAAGKVANRTPKPLTPMQQLKKDQKAARQAQKQLDRQNKKLAKNNMSVAQSNDKVVRLKQKYPNLGNQNIKAVPDTKLQKAAKFGKRAGKFALKKLAWPIALGYAANAAYKGYHSDPNASFAKKVKNAGYQAVDDYTDGAVGAAYNKIFGEAAKSLQEQGFTVQDLQEKVDQFILVKENVDTLRKIVADKSVMPVKFEDGTMKVDMTTASIFLQAFDKMREDNQAKVAEMMRTKAGFLRVMDIIYGAMK